MWCGVERIIHLVRECVCVLWRETHTHTHRVSLRDPTRELSIAFHTEATEIAPSTHTYTHNTPPPPSSPPPPLAPVSPRRGGRKDGVQEPPGVCACSTVAQQHSGQREREEGVCARSATPPKTET
jgi:hypothetical protein